MASYVVIRWDEHNINFSKQIVDLICNNFMLDITVICESQSVEAHKLALAAGSSFFRKMFINFPNILKVELDEALTPRIPLVDLRSVIEFIYKGEIVVQQERLHELLQSAEILGVSELVNVLKTISNKITHHEIENNNCDASNNSLFANPSSISRSSLEEITKCNLLKVNLKAEIANDQPNNFIKEHGDKSNVTRQEKQNQDEAREISDPSSEIRDAVCGQFPTLNQPINNNQQEEGETILNVESTAVDSSVPRKLHKQDKVFECTDCDYSTSVKANFRKHIQTHNRSLDYVCDVCGKKFRTKGGLNLHLKNHKGEDVKLRCSKCSFKTVQKFNLQKHLVNIHGIDLDGNVLPETFRCSECEFICIADHQLKMHMLRKHTLDKPFKCQQCNYMTVEKAALSKHIRIKHTDERPYMCEICGFSTHTVSGIARHRRSHTGIKPYKCSECSMAYADKKRLRDHMLKHSNEKPYVCEVCGFSCRRRDNLQLHMKKAHIGDSIVLQQFGTSDLLNCVSNCCSALNVSEKANSEQSSSSAVSYLGPSLTYNSELC